MFKVYVLFIYCEYNIDNIKYLFQYRINLVPKDKEWLLTININLLKCIYTKDSYYKTVLMEDKICYIASMIDTSVLVI